MADEYYSSAVTGSTAADGAISSNYLSGTTVDGTVYVYSGGLIESNTVHGGSVYIYSGGSAEDNSVTANGAIFVSGGVVMDTSVTNGSVEIYSGGSAENVSFEKTGTVRIKDAYAKNINGSGVSLTLASGGVAEDISIVNGMVRVNWYATADNVRLETNRSDAVMTSNYRVIVSGTSAVANNVYLGNLISAEVSSGGRINDLTLESGAQVKVYEFGTIGGKMVIEDGGIVSAVSEGATFDFTVSGHVSNGGYLINDLSAVSGSFNYTITVDAEQTGKYFLAGNAENFNQTITLNVGGENLGNITINGDMVELGVYQYILTQYNGDLVLDITEFWPDFYVSGTYMLSGEKLGKATVLSGGLLRLVSGAVASNVQLESNGRMYVSSGSILSGAVAESGAYIYVHSGGIANDIVTNGGMLLIRDGAVASNVDVVGTKGNLIVSSGAVVYDVNITSRVVQVYGGRVYDINFVSGGRVDVRENGVVGGKITVDRKAYIQFNGGTLDFTVSEHSVDGGYLVNNMSNMRGVSDITITVAEDQATGRYFLADNSYLSIGTKIYLNCGSESTGLYFTVRPAASVDKTGLNVVVYGNYRYQLDQNGDVLSLNVMDLSKGSTTITSGEVASASNEITNLFVESGAKLHLLSGGEVNGGVISGMGSMNISGGATASGMNIYRGGCLYVSSGGSIEDVDVFGTLRVMRSGDVEDAVVYSGGLLYLSTPGNVDNITVLSGGKMSAYGNVSANDISVESGGSVFFSSGAVSDLTVSSGGIFTINSGTINGLTIQSGGNVDLGMTEITGDLHIESGAYIYGGTFILDVTNRTTADSFIINDASVISNLGSVILKVDAQQAEGTYALGDNADNFSYSHGINIEIDGYSYTIYAGLSPIFCNGNLYRVRKNNGRLLLDIVSGVDSITYISAYTISGSLNDIETDGVIISGGGYMYVSSGGVANNTLVSGGYIYASSGAVLNNTVIGSSGVLSMYYEGGVTLNDTTVLSGGSISYSSSMNSNSFSNTVLQSGAIINGFNIAEDTVVESDFVISNAVVSSGRYARLYDNQSASDILITSYGSMYISAGAFASNLTVTDGGYLSIAGVRGASIRNFTTVASGADIYSGGTAHVGRYAYLNDVNVWSGGILDIYGGAVNRANVYDGGYASAYSSGRIYDAKVYSGGLIGVSGGMVKDTTVYESGAVVVKDRDSEAIDTIVSSGGVLVVTQSGFANGAVISSGGYFAMQTVASAENITVLSGGVFLGFTLNNSQTFDYVGAIYLHDTISGAVVNNSTSLLLNSNASSLLMGTARVNNAARVGEDGKIIDTLISGGSKNMAAAHLISGGYASKTTVAFRGSLYVSRGGTADDTVIYSGGKVTVYESGVANNVIVNYGGQLIDNGGSATVAFNPWGSSYSSSNIVTLERDANIYYGGSGSGANNGVSGAFISKFDSSDEFSIAAGNSAIVYSGGVANETYVNYSGTLIVSSGGTATAAYTPWKGKIKVMSGGSFTQLGRDANIYYGGKENGFIAKYNSVSDLEVTSGNSAIVYSKGEAANTTVSSGGSMFLSSGSIHRGSLTIESGGYVSAAGKASIEFSLADAAPDSEYLINDLSAIKGSPSYTITVADDQLGGTYYLAQNASYFANKSINITIGNGSIDIDDETGEVTETPAITISVDVNGNSVYVDTSIFTITLDVNNNLILDLLNGYNTKAFLWEGERLVSGAINMKKINVATGQELVVSSGGTVSSASIVSGATANIYYGASAGTLNVNGGVAKVWGGASVSSVNVANDAQVSVDGDVSKLVVSSGSVNVGGNGDIDNFQMQNGSAVINGSVDSLNVAGGSVTVGAGAVVSGFNARKGSVTFEAGTQLSGKVAVSNGANVVFEDGSELIIDLTSVSINNTALISGLASCSGTPDIFINVDELQSVGEYRLSDAIASPGFVSVNVDGFSGIINNEAVEYGKRSYSLVSKNGSMMLYVTRSVSEGGYTADNSVELSGDTEFAGKSYLISEAGMQMSDWVGFGDDTDYMKFDLESAANLSFDIESSDAVKFVIYKVTEKNGSYSLSSVQTTTVNANSNISTKNILLDAGTYYASVSNPNAAKGGDAEYTLKLSENSTFFTNCNNSDDWSDMQQSGDASEQLVSLGNITNADKVSDWVGFGDSKDCMQFDLEEAAKLSFDVESDESIKISICSLTGSDGKYSLKTLQSTTAAGNITTAGLLLESGTYYLCVENTNAAKGGSADYSVSLNDSSVFYTNAVGGEIDDWQNVKTEGDRGLGGMTVEVSQSNKEIVSDGWVGLGDETDYHRIVLNDAAQLSFDITAGDAAKYTIYSLSETNRGGVYSYSLKTLQSGTLALDKETGKYTIDTKAILLGPDTYYIGITSTNAAKGGNADYSVSLNDSSVFFDQTNDGNNWGDLAENGINGNIDEPLEITSENIGSFLVEEGAGWVGYNDAVDYYAFTLEDSAKLSFSVSATDAAKFTVYTLVEKTVKGKKVYSLKVLQNSTLKLDKNTGMYTIDTAALLLAGSESAYYAIGVTSTNAAKGGNAQYSVSINSSSVVFDDGNILDDTYDGEITDLGVLKSGEESTITFSEWVGIGDEIDFAKFTVEHDMDINFSVLSSDAVKLTIYSLGADGKLKSLVTTSGKADKEALTKVVELKTGETYYVSVASTNAAKGGNALFTVTGQAAGIKAKVTNGIADAELDALLDLWTSGAEDNWDVFAAENVPAEALTGFIRGTASADDVNFAANKSRLIDGISLGIGDDKITFADSNAKGKYENYFTPVSSVSERTGTIGLGSGNDTLTVGKNNVIDGLDSIDLGEGNDKIHIHDGAEMYVYGTDGSKGILFGSGDDTLVIAKNGYLFGLPQFGGGNDTLQLDGILDLRGAENASADLMSVENIKGKGYVLISEDVDSNFADIFDGSGVTVVNTVTDSKRFSTPESELKDNTAAKAQAITVADGARNIWLCGDGLASQVDCGFSDAADCFKFVKNDTISSVEFTWDNGCEDAVLQLVDAKDNVLADYDLSETSIIDVSEWKNGTYYFKVGVVENGLVAGSISLK